MNSPTPPDPATPIPTAPRAPRAPPRFLRRQYYNARRFYDWLLDSPLGFAVQLILLALWLGLVFLLVKGLGLEVQHGKHVRSTATALVWAVIALCSLPKLIMLCIFITMRYRSTRLDYDVIVPDEGSSSLATPLRRKQVLETWRYEARHMIDALRRAGEHAGICGFIASLSLGVCALILAPAIVNRSNLALHQLVAIAVVSATCVSFALITGRSLVRAASRDSSAHMFAWGAKSLLVTVATTVLFAVLLIPQANAGHGQGATQVFATPAGAILLGGGVALLGERALRAISERAATMLGVPEISPQAMADLRSVDGLTDDDILRLAEEGVDSVHALAFVPTPRMFFNTTHSLQRIVDWQDQALLLVLFGRQRYQRFRDELGIRGVIDALALAQRVDDAFQSESRVAAGVRSAENSPAAPTSPSSTTVPPHHEDWITEVSRLVGFASVTAFREACRAMLTDEVAARLSLYWQSSPRRSRRDRDDEAEEDAVYGRKDDRDGALAREGNRTADLADSEDDGGSIGMS